MAIPTYLTLDQMLKQTPASRADLAMVLTRFRESVFLNSLTFENRPGQAFMQWVETTDLPSTAARALNADFTASQGRTEVNFAPFKVYGGKLQHDEAAEDMGLADPIGENERMARSLRLTLEYDSVYADPSVDRTTLTGMQYLAENSGDTTLTSISAGATSGGAALSKNVLDNTIDKCIDPMAIVMGQPLRNRFTDGSRDSVVAGAIQWSEDSFGTPLASYGRLPIIPLERTAANVQILGFTEAASTGASTATSLYILGRGYQWGQNGPPKLTPLARTGSQMPREMRWILANKAPRYSVIRLKHIGDSPLVP